MRRSKNVINLKDENAYREFHMVLAAMDCLEQGLKDAREVVKSDQRGEYKITTRTLTGPAFALTATTLVKSMVRSLSRLG